MVARLLFAAACVVVLTVAATVSGCRNEVRAPAEAGGGGRLERPYPIEAFEAVDLDSHPISLTAWKGRVVVVNVWATWCAPCRREMPALGALQAKYPDRVRVLGLLQDNVTDEFARRFLRAAAVTYPVVRSTFDIERRFPAVLALPTTYILDSAGRLVAMYAGELDPGALEREVLTMLGK